MISIRSLSLPHKIVAIIMIISASALLVSSGALIAVDFFEARRDLRASTEVFARIVADNTVAAVSFNDQAAALDTLNSLRAEPSVVGSCIYTPEGLFASRVPQNGAPCSSQPVAAKQTKADVLVGVPIELNGKQLGTVQLRATLAPAYARLRLEIATLAGILLFSILFALVLSSRLQKLVSEPILSLARTANAVSLRKDRSIRATKHSQDELGILVDAFNKMLEEIQARESELVQANRMKDEFLATLSHELRTPLTAIYGWVEILRNTPPDAGKMSKGLEVIDRNARAQTRLVDDLLNVSRIITGNLKVELAWIDPLPLIQTAVDSIGPAIEAKSIELVTHLDQNVGLIFADSARWQQVLWNLLANAVKFTHSGGRITVDFGRIGTQAQLNIADSGEGIEPEFLPHVFDRFTQADSSSTRRHGGLGLGLAIVRHIVELHGGRVIVHSEGRDKGSTFIVQLPIPPFRDQHVPIEKHDSSSLEGLRVLLVEDDDDTREVVSDALKRYGASVIEAASAGEALQLFVTKSPDVLVADIGMPDMNGYELLSKIRSEDRGRDIPAVAVTAFASPEDRQKSLRAGFQAHISKPISVKELIAAIDDSASK
ncbi:MAG TPA: ATP-binding protein [Terriglobia bacterium]|nr:ATP-binding protein [Terriglobia bacterium]